MYIIVDKIPLLNQNSLHWGKQVCIFVNKIAQIILLRPEILKHTNYLAIGKIQIMHQDLTLNLFILEDCI